MSMLPLNLKELLSTNHALSDEQLAEVLKTKQEISRWRRDTISIKNECSAFLDVAQSQQINDRLRQLERDMMDCTFLLNSPIRRLPPDVLSEIFVHSLRSPNSTQRNREVLRICHISSWWRKLAFDTPYLWTSLCLVLPRELSSTETNAEGHPIVTGWLSRTGTTLPLSIRLDIDVVNQKTTKKGRHTRSCLRLIVTMIKPYTDRIRHLDLGTSFTYSLYVSFLTYLECLASLDSLILRGEASSIHFPMDHELHISPNASELDILPYLSHVKLERDLLADDLRPNEFLLPWRFLTHLTINYVHGAHWIELISMCPNLQQGAFHFTENLDRRESLAIDILPTYPLHHLNDLTLTFMTSFDPFVFYRLETPALTTLRLGASLEDNMDFWASDANYMFAQIGNIRRLALIKEWPIDVHPFERILRHTPLLTDLELELDSKLEPLFKVLHTAFEQPLVPKLSSLLIDTVNYYASRLYLSLETFPLRPLLSFLRSRELLRDNDGVHYLRFFRLLVTDRGVQTEKEETLRIWNVLRTFQTPSLKVSMVSSHHEYSGGWRDRLHDVHSSIEALNETV